MKKVGLITWYTYHNYGTALQATALSHCIEKLGYESEMIKYIPKGGWKVPEKLNKEWILQRFRENENSKRVYSSEKREKLFSDFLENKLNESEICRSYPELYDLNSKYDAFVCGSDQIWAPICYEPAYFLPFVENPNKMIAYAPSFGSTEIKSPLIANKIRNHIKRFSHLSVREKQGAELIKNLTGQQAEVVLDPTLLMNSDEWNDFAGVENLQKLDKKKYIICYFMGGAERYIDYVKVLSEKTGMPFYLIPVTKQEKKSEYSIPFEAGPSEFVSLIKNSSYVCTDSFHGLSFAVNYQRPFFVFKRFSENDPKNQNSRITSLLKILKLENRLVDSKDRSSVQKNLTCDFKESEKILKKLQEKSLDFLSKALADATETPLEKLNPKNFKITDLCCGCGTCASVCPQKAIEIRKDNQGFEHYFIDSDSCIACGTCRSVCPMNNISAPQIQESKSLYSIKSNSSDVLRGSSSGGVGYEIASYLQKKGYIVCGCTYNKEKKSAEHIVINPDETEKLCLIQGSKYIQSVSSYAMKKIAKMDADDKLVFFGTPCQTAAVDKLLKKKKIRENAVLVDLICHGVPSDYLWKKYLSELDRQYHTGDNPEVAFRSKESEWRSLMIKVSGNGNTYKKGELKDNFYAFFRRGLCYMETCSDCPYRERSSSDIRIGDYWGSRYKDDKEGVSMVIANTLKGKKIIEHLDKCKIQEHALSEYWTVQFPYNQPRPLIREQLIEELKNDKISLDELNKKYCSYFDYREKLYRIKDKIKSILKPGA